MFTNWPSNSVFDFWNSLHIGLSETVALAAVALIGYLFGQRTRRIDVAAVNARRHQELERASSIARQLESIADALRQDLASHHGQLSRFKRRLVDAQEAGDDKAWQSLCLEAESILAPTMQLAQQLSVAYDSIRQQSDALETFTEGRTDPLTGVGSGRALQEKLDILIAAAERNGGEFSVALVSLDRTPTTPPESESQRKAQLPDLARVICACMRGSDFVARYGDDEFVVVMPNTKLAGACVFGDRLQNRVREQLSASLSCGLAEYHPNDDAKSLLGRADSAFYSAKAAHGNRQFVHTGTQIREHRAASTPQGESSGGEPGASAVAPITTSAPIDPSVTV